MNVSSSGDFKVSHSQGANGSVVRLAGTIDEKFDPTRVFNGLGNVVVFDMKNVGRITSFGVREWVRGLAGISGSTCFFVNCRPNIMAQFNMVPNFSGKGFVLSFFAPYRCPECGEETELLVDVRTKFDLVRQAQVPEEKCPKCGSSMEFDDVPEVFFAYFASARLPSLTAELSALVDQASSEGSTHTPTAGGLRAIKQIDDVVTGVWLTGRLDARASVKRALADLEGYVTFVLSGIEACDAAGLGRLAQYTVAPGKKVRFSFARVPPAAFAALQTLPPELVPAPIVSLEVPFRCSGCGTNLRQEVDIAEVSSLARAVKQHLPFGVCTSCGSNLLPTIEPRTLAVLTRTQLGLAPPAVRSFLDRHRSAPAATPAAGGNFAGAPATPPAIRFGGYEVIRPLGSGGMAEIFLARLKGPEGFSKTLVIKKISRGLASDGQFLQMFLAEARLAARISHPNVVQIFELGQEQGQYFIAMEYVPGWNLNTVLATAHRREMLMPIEVACRIVSDVCGGLAAAHSLVDEAGHSLGVVHRDVSPHNVLISPQGAVKLTDFGIAKAADAVERTKPGVVKGKVAYLSPEAVEGLEIDSRSDIFAAGVLLYECLACRQLFRRATEAETMEAVRNCLIVPIARIREGVPAALESIVMRALARKPGARYGTASEMQRALEYYLAGIGKPATSAELASYLKQLMDADVKSTVPTDSEELEETSPLRRP